jgi:hypothetical protein
MAFISCAVSILNNFKAAGFVKKRSFCGADYDEDKSYHTL